MDQGLIPRRYAKALLEVSDSRGESAALYSQMTRLQTAFEAEPELGRTVANPFVGFAEKAGLLETAAGVKPGDKDAATFVDFVRLLVRNRRIDLMREMTKAYIELYRLKNNIVRVEVESAAPLTEEARKRLRAIIAKKMPSDGTIEFVEKVEPGLIGGFVININNERLDASVKNELERLRLNLLK